MGNRRARLLGVSCSRWGVSLRASSSFSKTFPVASGREFGKRYSLGNSTCINSKSAFSEIFILVIHIEFCREQATIFLLKCSPYNNDSSEGVGLATRFATETDWPKVPRRSLAMISFATMTGRCFATRAAFEGLEACPWMLQQLLLHAKSFWLSLGS